MMVINCYYSLVYLGSEDVGNCSFTRFWYELAHLGLIIMSYRTHIISKLNSWNSTLNEANLQDIWLQVISEHHMVLYALLHV